MSATPHRLPDTARLFLALWPGPVVRNALLAWRDAWAWTATASPVAPERLHLTLHFIGEVPRSRLPELMVGLQVPMHRFNLSLGRFEMWPHGMTVLEPDPVPSRLLHLQASLGEALRGLGLATETRAFRPHVTLARHADGAMLPAPRLPVRWRVRGYALVESSLKPPSTYCVLKRYQ